MNNGKLYFSRESKKTNSISPGTPRGAARWFGRWTTPPPLGAPLSSRRCFDGDGRKNARGGKRTSDGNEKAKVLPDLRMETSRKRKGRGGRRDGGKECRARTTRTGYPMIQLHSPVHPRKQTHQTKHQFVILPTNPHLAESVFQAPRPAGCFRRAGAAGR